MFNWLFNNKNNETNKNSENNNNTNIISLLLNLYQQNPQEVNQLIQLFVNNRNHIINNRLIENDNQIETLNNNNKKRSLNNDPEIDDIVRQMETTSKKSNKKVDQKVDQKVYQKVDQNVEEKVEEKKQNKRKKEKTIIWTRISSKYQENNTSLDLQEKECKDYIQKLNSTSFSLNNTNYTFPTDSITLKMIGSGYSLTGSVRENFDLIDGYLDDNYKLFIVCYMPDRFLRSKNKALDFIKKCNEAGGEIHFVKSVDNCSLVSSNTENYKKIEEFFSLAENESKIKSIRSRDAAECKIDTLIIRSLDDPETVKIRKFIHSFLNGDTVENVLASFRELVNWDIYPEWYEQCYNEPIEINDSLKYTKNGTQYLSKFKLDSDKESRIHSIVYLFKQFKIEIPAFFSYRKRWDAKFIKRLSVDHLEELTSNLDNL